MNPIVGDTVRYLNSVGGGKVVRIAGDIAYVDEDGFETPVLVRECVVVAHAGDDVPTRSFRAPRVIEEAPKPAPAPVVVKEKAPDEPTRLPVIETAGGNVLNIVLGFEASDLKTLSKASFDAYVVNDSNYYLAMAIMSRSEDCKDWQLRYSGVIEPNIQEFAFALTVDDLPSFDRLAVQYVAYKTESSFAAKAPGFVEFNIDATKFAKLHCFRPNPYFDVPVIALDVTVADKPQSRTTVDAVAMAQSLQGAAAARAAKEKAAPAPRKQVRREAPDLIEVDLHASELFDSIDGLEPADILNAQINKFSEVMDANLRRPGTKIVFIHGKGEGVLRQAIMKELTHRYKGHDVQDASFREYGFGATQVTIRQQAANKPQASWPHGKDRRR